MRNLLIGAAALAVLAAAPVAAQSVCEKMKPQYPQGYCDGSGSFHPGNGTVITPDGRSTSERSAMPPPPQARQHSGTNGAPNNGNAMHSDTNGRPQ